MKASPTFSILVAISLASTSVFAQEGLHDLVKPSLDDMRRAADEERKREEEAQEKVRMEAETKRLEEEARQKELEAAKADPLVEVGDMELSEDAGGASEYVIQSGDTLGGISADRYGSSQYYPVIEYWNDCTATKVYVGQVIKTPSIATIAKVKGKEVLSRYPEEMSALIQLRVDYLALEGALRAEAEAGEMSEATKESLTAIRDSAKKVHGGFLVKRPGVEAYATSLLAQCKSMTEQLDAMLAGDFGRQDSRISRVHSHLGQALRNAFVWGDEDFK